MNLSRLLIRRFEQTRLIEDLERAITASNDAINLTPKDTSHRAKYLNALSNALLLRFEWMGTPEDLDTAIAAAYESISCPTEAQNVLSIAYYYNNLGNALSRRLGRSCRRFGRRR